MLAGTLKYSIIDVCGVVLRYSRMVVVVVVDLVV